ncbi:MAG: glycoside hydrolase family 2 protein [Firmicutes bacterium]|nr:glycoside hydrolase family 2 protein [Bacillota bacterium]
MKKKVGTSLPINNNWFFRKGFHDGDLATYDQVVDFEPVRIPHTNVVMPHHYFDESIYQFESLYKTKLPEIEKDSDQLVLVHFEGVMASAVVYLNGIEVGSHQGGYTPFEVDITDVLAPQNNWLMVRVNSAEAQNIPPFGFVIDYLTYGGIYREVQLITRNHTHFKSVKVETPTDEEGHFYAKVLLTLTAGAKGLICSLYDGETLIAHQAISGITDLQMTLELHSQTSLVPWHIDAPKRYRMILQLETADAVIDYWEAMIGFRTVSFTETGFTLNGQPLKLRGLNRHQSYPYVGYAMPWRAQYADADLLKNTLGVNIVRSSHYPPSKHFLDRCDEIGLLVFNEIPGWQHIGDEAWQSIAIKNVEEMIRRDWNHPSVIIWGVRINESPDSDAFYEKTNAMAKSLDTTRPTGGVRNFAGSHLLEDVYTYNDFVHRGYNHALDTVKDIAKKRVPYLVTEHNGHMFPTKTFDSESKRIEHAYRHARVLEAAYASNEISGAIGWCMNDYNTHKDFGSGDRICYHGVLDAFRLPKYAAAVYASQSDTKPLMTVASNLYVGDFDASELGKITIFTNCEEVKVYKNDVYLSTFTPDRVNFGHLPHPPIIVDDLIGSLIKDQERFSPKDAETIKRLLLKFVEKGNKLPLLDQLKMGLLFMKYKMDMAEGARLYGKYIASWGEKSTVFRFDGYIANSVVCSVLKDSSRPPQLTVVADDDTLREGTTYDVTRVSLQLMDDNGQPLHYANHVITVHVEGPLEIIGPKTFALIGGQRAFWLKTTGQSGQAAVTIHAEELGVTKTLSINVSSN